MHSGKRLTLSLGVGALLGVLSPIVFPGVRSEWGLGLMIAWSGVCATFLLSVWPTLQRSDGEATRLLSERQDDSRAVSRGLLLSGALVSLFAVGASLLRAHELAKRNDPLEVVLILGTVFTVALTWLLVHVEAMLHYARLYYDGDDGGVDFGHERPSYWDFAYLAFTVGMTYQVSDTTVTDPRIRKAILHHALLSFLFGTTLFALTINGVASLAS